MNLREVRRVVGRIKGTLFKNSNSYSIGKLKSHFRGSGLQFKEHQIYAPGDDVRFIDWKILAKTNVPFVKTFEEERNVEIAVVIDATPSMMMGYEGVSKLQAAIEVTCLLYLLSKETSDSVRALIIADDIYDLPRKSGEAGISILISKLADLGILDEDGNFNYEYRAFMNGKEDSVRKEIYRHLKNKRELVILSDFASLFDKKELHRLIFNRHVHAFQIVSPLDEAKSIPYFIQGFSATGKTFFGSQNLNDKDLEDIMSGKVKKLKVSERYLEDFIKEML